jgi:hypothetical protein
MKDTPVRFAAVAALMLALGVGMNSSLSGVPPGPPDGPQFTADGRLQKPENYREWIWLSSGLGMSYGPMSENISNEDPPFDNVFVNPSAYRHFLRAGTWPDKAIFILEIRSSVSKGSINQGGHFQGELRGVEAEVKDESRPGKWVFFGFNSSGAPAKPIPANASCYSCHAQNGAVDNTFVQFYPTLQGIAKQKGTFAPTPGHAAGVR